MSRAGGRYDAVAMRDCGISTTSQTRPVCKHCFSALPIVKTSSVEAQIGLLWCSFCSSSYRVWVGLKRKTPRCWIQISESHTRGVARIPLGLMQPSWDSRATSQRDLPIWIQPHGVFCNITHGSYGCNVIMKHANKQLSSNRMHYMFVWFLYHIMSLMR